MQTRIRNKMIARVGQDIWSEATPNTRRTAKRALRKQMRAVSKVLVREGIEN